MTVDIYSKILNKLETQRKEEGKLPLLLDFYYRLLQVQSRASKRIGVIKPTQSNNIISERVNRGIPLVDYNNLVIDWALLREIFTETIAVFDDHPELFGEIPARLKGPKAGRLLTQKAVRAWLRSAPLPPTLSADDISEVLLRVIIQAALNPFLTSYSQALINSVDLERWRRNYCPICGGIPDFAFLDKERGSRWLLCSRCDTQWIYQRLICPYCANQDQQTLAYFTDDKGLYRLYVCERCKHYLKAIDLRQTEDEILLTLERFYTLDLDTQARQEGYDPYFPA